MACACLGSLQDGPDRTVTHGPLECLLRWSDGEEEVSVAPLGRCPRCKRIQRVAGEVCRGCVYAQREERASC